MSKKISYGSQTFVVPDDATDDEITQIVDASSPSSANVPPAIKAASSGASGSWGEEPPDAWQGAGDAVENTVTNLGVGAAKSLFGTLANAGRFSDLITRRFASPAQMQKSDEEIERLSTPRNTAQKIGGGLEQAAEMYVTGGPLKSGAEFLAGKAPAMIARAAAPAARIGAEALNAGTSAALHDEDPKSAAIYGASGAAASEAAPLIAPSLKRWAQQQYARFLNPTKQATKNMTERVVPELLDRGVRVPRVSDKAGAEYLADKAAQEAGKVGEKIGQAVENVPSAVQPQIQPILDTLENYKNSFIVNGVRVNEAAVQNAEKLQDTIHALGSNVSYQSLNRARQILDEGVARAGGYYGKTLAEGSMVDAQREAANAMRRQLSQASPDISKLNAEFHFWSQVRDIAEATAERKTGQQGLINTLWGIAGTGLGLGELTGHGGPIAHGAEGALALGMLAKALRSPAWRTTSAVFKNQLATQLANGNAGEVMKILARAGVAAEPSLGDRAWAAARDAAPQTFQQRK